MVSDRLRTDAFAAAIREVVRPSDVVLDVGTGTGSLYGQWGEHLSIAAAKPANSAEPNLFELVQITVHGRATDSQGLRNLGNGQTSLS